MESRQLRKEEEINLLDLVLVLFKRKRLILGGMFLVSAIVAVIMLFWPNSYEAQTKLMPPQESSNSAAAQLLSSLGGVAGVLLGGGSGGMTGDLYITLMQTQVVLDPIIDRFDLMKLYGQSTREDTRKYIIGDALRAEVDPRSGITIVAVTDKDPKRAAEMANAFVEELKKLLDGLAVTEAAKRRVFFEAQLEKATQSLVTSEEALKGFQETTGAVKIDEQAAAVLASISSIKAQIATKEVQANVMRTYATESNPDLKRLAREVRALREQLDKLEQNQGNCAVDALIPTGQLPSLGTEYIRRLRDFKYNETLYELMVKQFEAAKLDEARETGILQVIHKAEPPEKKAKPNRTLSVLMAAGASFFLFMFVAFLLEFLERASENPEQNERLQRIKGYLKKL